MEPVLNGSLELLLVASNQREWKTFICYLELLHLRSGRASFSQIERTKQESDPRHPLFQHEPAPNTLKFGNSFIHAVKPLDGKPHREPLPTWHCLNRLGTGVERFRPLKQRWEHTQDANIECDCGEDPKTTWQ